MAKMNCWEIKKCGREQGGAKVVELGECAAAIEVKTHGIHGGKNAGRCCWVVTGTLCGGQKQGEFASKLGKCMVCDFFKSVMKEEGKDFLPAQEILKKLK
ncbi:MAG TPA: hypothetical protein DCL35_07145 [Candidatus Omnitrophica bacterium]|nr:hypothetical protein [Candidatus Omnitrophota bacterium]